MSSIMRSRSALPGRCEGSEVIGGSSLELKVAGPSMLGIGCPDRHALPLTHAPPSPKIYRPRRASSRESGFVLCPLCMDRLPFASEGCCGKSLICIRPVDRLAGRGLDGNTHAPLISLADRPPSGHSGHQIQGASIDPFHADPQLRTWSDSSG